MRTGENTGENQLKFPVMSDTKKARESSGLLLRRKERRV